MTYLRLGLALLVAVLFSPAEIFAQPPAGVAGKWVLLMPADPADVRRSPIRLAIERDDEGVDVTRHVVARDAAQHDGYVFLADSSTYYPYKRGFVVTGHRAEWLGQTLVTRALDSPASTTYSLNDRGLLLVEYRSNAAADPRTDVYVRDVP